MAVCPKDAEMRLADAVARAESAFTMHYLKLADLAPHRPRVGREVEAIAHLEAMDNHMKQGGDLYRHADAPLVG